MPSHSNSSLRFTKTIFSRGYVKLIKLAGIVAKKVYTQKGSKNKCHMKVNHNILVQSG